MILLEAGQEPIGPQITIRNPQQQFLLDDKTRIQEVATQTVPPQAVEHSNKEEKKENPLAQKLSHIEN